MDWRMEFTHLDGKIDRVELIDHRLSSGKPGRVFTSTDVGALLLSIQDDGRTLKLFIS